MFKLGISSSCFYPVETEISFDKVCLTGCKYAELFICAPSELEEAFVKQIKEKADSAGVQIIAVHPFTSFMENTFLFSPYIRRFNDSIPLYKRYFEICRLFGANILTLHGAKDICSIPDEEHFRRFALLSDIGREYGVTLCQENVVHFKAQTADYLERMSNAVGENFGITLDIKQARRAGADAQDIIDRLSPFIKHIHLSDFNDEKDCIPPCSGKYNFEALFSKLKSVGYDGGLIIELYNHSYKEESEVKDSFNALNLMLNL